MNFDMMHIRHCLLYQYELGNNATQAHKNLTAMFGKKAPIRQSCYDWYIKFDAGDFSLEDDPRPGRPSELKDEDLWELLATNTRASTREMEIELGFDHSTIARHLNKLGLVQKLGAWVPHDLSRAQQMQRVSICQSLLNRKRTLAWVDNLVTGDEKWVLYVNHTRKKQWLPKEVEPEPDPKAPRYPEKVMLCVFWDKQGIIWWDLLPDKQTINANIYSEQLLDLAKALKKKRPKLEKVAFLHDNARPHTAFETWVTLVELGWQVLPHPAYSPDLAPSDYHLFRELARFLQEKSFDDFAHVKKTIRNFFASLSPEFFAKGIDELSARWRQVIENNGQYILD
jgi:[histone H3]-lysine36 N-dimethyltransferase SETMAR